MSVKIFSSRCDLLVKVSFSTHKGQKQDHKGRETVKKMEKQESERKRERKEESLSDIWPMAVAFWPIATVTVVSLETN